MKKAFFASLIVGVFASGALAAPIAPGETLPATVVGSAAIYQIFGHAGNPGGDIGPGPASDAVLFQFAAGAGNVFSFTASGLVSCCNTLPNTPPDGISGGISVIGANGLSNVAGTTGLPLLGVFTTDTDPFGSTPPATLSWDASNATSLSPLLDQVFYIGDGRAGYQNAAGSLLSFTAPAGATRLYLGVPDAFNFNGTTGYYQDNLGSYAVTVTLAPSAVPEPEIYAMFAAGFGMLGLVARRRRRVRQVPTIVPEKG